MNNMSKMSLCAIMLAFSVSCAYADGMVFEPVEMPSFNSTPAPAPQSLPVVKETPAPAASSSAITNQASNNTANSSSKTTFFDRFSANNQPKVADMSLKENQDMQSALVNLDTSQIELRQNLQTLEEKYYNTDANYQKYKEERAALHKQIKITNKKLKNLEKVKNTIRKNML